MLDLFGTVFDTAAICIILTSVTGALRTPASRPSILAGLLGIWIGLAVAASESGLFADPTRGPPAALVFFSLPLIATALVAAFSARARSALLAIPTPLLIRLNVLRLGGLMFLLLAAADRLSGPFPYLAGWGDVITGAMALPVALLASRELTANRRRILAWNAFGMLDLILAVTLGVLSRNGSPVQLIHAGVGSAALAQLPWSLIPSLLVPYFLVSHGLVFAQLRARRADVSFGRPQPGIA
jgi:hypothetical protein